jgi:peroxiredoxin
LDPPADHLANASLGPLCLKLVYYPSPRRDVFLRAVAERSPDRVVRGRATLALAQYLKNKGDFILDLKKPTGEKEEKSVIAIYGSDYVKQLRATDPAPMRREAGQLLARVTDDFGDVAYVSGDGKPSRETLADVARRDRRPWPALSASVGPDQPHEEFRAIDKSFRAAVEEADQASNAAQKKAGKTEPGEESVRAYVAAYPKWPDSGMKMWRLAQDAPRHNAAFDALIWLVEQGPRFLDSRAERDKVMSQVVDTLIRDHLDAIAEHLTDRNVAMALNFGQELPAGYRERLLRALFERGRDRSTRGRMGLALGRYLNGVADSVERLARPGAPDSWRPWELLFLDPAVADQLRKADRQAIARQAEDALSRVIADYGDVIYVNGQVATAEKLAAVAERELVEIRSISVGRTAPEIIGKDAFGKPMKLSEFRGKVVLLDFGSHEHCGACKLVYPRLRATLDRLRDRPFVILGINNNDRREPLKEAIAHREITWRCWWDGDEPDGSGPITKRWNVRGYPTFFLIDHQGVIRSKADTHPFDASFDSAIESLLKEAETDHLHK